MKVTPLRDYICIQPEASKAVSNGGIIIPDDAKEKPRKAVVVAVGRGRITDYGKLIEPEVKVGDRKLPVIGG